MLLACHPWVEDDPNATIVNSELVARAFLTLGSDKGAIRAVGHGSGVSGAATAGDMIRSAVAGASKQREKYLNIAVYYVAVPPTVKAESFRVGWPTPTGTP